MTTIVETTWNVGRRPHSWITCVTRSRQVAEEFVADQMDPKARHQLTEISAEFPLYFVDIPNGYRHILVDDLRDLLQTAPLGKNDEILFSVHCFKGEYRWGPPFRDLTSSDHFHVFNRSLMHYRAGKGELRALLDCAT